MQRVQLRNRYDGDGGWRSNKYGERQRLVAILGMLVALGIVGGLVLAELWIGFIPIPQALLPAATPGAGASPTATDAPTPKAISVISGGWTTYLSSAGTGFNALESVITPETAAGLQLHWTKQGASVISVQPVEANGLIYWGDWFGNEHATSVAGHAVWSTNLGRTLPNVPACPINGFTYNPNPGIVSTTASIAPIKGRSMVFVGGGDAQLYALDALTGTILWHTRVGPSPATFIWSSPAVYDGSVYVGVASFADCPLVAGQLLRLDAATGAIQNRFTTVPSGCAGGTVWGSPTIDAANGFVYFATGGPDLMFPCGRPTPYTNALIKVRASDLSLVDHWQVPYDEQVGDRDFGNTPTLFFYSTGAVAHFNQHPMVGVAHKNGTYYAFDRDHLSAGPVWRAHIAYGGGQPTADQGSISPSAFDGKTLYVAGEYTVINGVGCLGSLRALNPATGAVLWEHCMHDGPVYGAVTAVRGLVVVGEGPWIVMVAANTGQTLFSYRNPTGGWFYGAASIADGVLYQGNTDGRLFAFGLCGRCRPT